MDVTCRTAVAVRAGGFKWIWKGLEVAVLEVILFFKKLFSREGSR